MLQILDSDGLFSFWNVKLYMERVNGVRNNFMNLIYSAGREPMSQLQRESYQAKYLVFKDAFYNMRDYANVTLSSTDLSSLWTV
jgi:hypothetical protein